MFSLKRLRSRCPKLILPIMLGLVGAWLNPAAVWAETLSEALASAYHSNPSLLIERARVREIDETYVQAQAQGRLSSTLLGSLEGQAVRLPNRTAQGQDLGGHSTTTISPSSAQLQLIQPLYQGGRVRALKSQAMANILAAREALRLAENNLFLQVATAYINVLRDEEIAHIRREDVRILTHQLQAAKDRFDVGTGTRTDIAQAETRLASANIGLAQADASLQISRAAYVREVGHMPANLQPVAGFVLPDSLEDARQTARKHNPQILSAEYRQQGAESAINVAQSASKPTVSLAGTAQAVRNQVGLIDEAESAGLAVQVTVPILSGGVNKSRVRAAEHARTRAMFETRNIEKNIDQAIEQSWAQLEASKRILTSAHTQVRAAQIAYEGVELEQELGTRSTLDVLNAEQELLTAKLSVIQARASVKRAEFQLLSIMGGFDSLALNIPVDRYSPQDNFEDIQSDPLFPNIDKLLPEFLKSDTEN